MMNIFYQEISEMFAPGGRNFVYSDLGSLFLDPRKLNFIPTKIKKSFVRRP